MVLLSNGCRRSKVGVIPKNWQSIKAGMRKKWVIHYRFYDPAFKHDPKYRGKKQVMIRTMNNFYTLAERQAITRTLLATELDALDRRGYNPISRQFMIDPENATPVITAPVMPKLNAWTEPTGSLDHLTCIQALRFALQKIDDIEEHTVADISSVITYFEKSATMLKLHLAPISTLSRKDIRAILDNCAHLTVTKKVYKRHEGGNIVWEKLPDGKSRRATTEVTVPKIWTLNQFNCYRKYLSILFNELVELEAVKENIIEDIGKKKRVTLPPRLLTPQERHIINAHLLGRDPDYRRFVHIFFHAGSRRSELFGVQGEWVDLERQRYQVLIKKGTASRWVWKTIKDVALPFWIEAMKGCGPKDYLFSIGFKPGPQGIGEEYATRRWQQYVKIELGIVVDFYKLKHLHTTEVSEIIGEEDPAATEAAEHNSHTTTAMVKSIYDVNYQERKQKKIKGIANKFA